MEVEKRVLIIGEHSYIGNSFKRYVEKQQENLSEELITKGSIVENTHIDWNVKLEAETVGASNGAWKNADFSNYDVILHVAAIVHQKETPEKASLYTEVNTKMPVEVAKRAKEAGVSQFIFLSTMAVYGEVEGAITKDTPLNPTTMYGKTKLAAEQRLAELADENFRIVILRPPMVYGENCPGNYTKLKKLARILPVFPDVENKRSMVHVDTLCQCVEAVIMKNIDLQCVKENKAITVIHPQNKQLTKTTEMYVEIRAGMGKKTYTTKIFNGMIQILKGKIGAVRKLFGSCYYNGVD